jgi:hypothetical protein
MSTNKQKRWIRRRLILTGVLVGALTALSVSAAQADPSQYARPGHGYAGVRVPTQGGSAAVSRTATVTPTPLVHDSPPAQSFRQQPPPKATIHSTTAASSSGFAWRAAAVGAGIATITLVLIGAALQTTRTRRNPPVQPA